MAASVPRTNTYEETNPWSVRAHRSRGAGSAASSPGAADEVVVELVVELVVEVVPGVAPLPVSSAQAASTTGANTANATVPLPRSPRKARRR